MVRYLLILKLSARHILRLNTLQNNFEEVEKNWRTRRRFHHARHHLLIENDEMNMFDKNDEPHSAEDNPTFNEIINDGPSIPDSFDEISNVTSPTLDELRTKEDNDNSPRAEFGDGILDIIAATSHNKFQKALSMDHETIEQLDIPGEPSWSHILDIMAEIKLNFAIMPPTAPS